MDERCPFGSLWSASLAACVRRRAYDVLLHSYAAPIEHRRQRDRPYTAPSHCGPEIWKGADERRKTERIENTRKLTLASTRYF